MFKNVSSYFFSYFKKYREEFFDPFMPILVIYLEQEQYLEWNFLEPSR